ncbi:MAG: hypothetical protein WDA07_15240 [Leucobacter sp.]
MSDLAAALAAIQQEHTMHLTGWPGVHECRCDEWSGCHFNHAEHVAALQVAYLREHPEHLTDLGLARESKLNLGGDGHWREQVRYITGWSENA